MAPTPDAPSIPATALSKKRAAGDSVQNDQNKRPNFGTPNELVTFKIGKKKKQFVVHKEFVCHYSPVLSAALNSNFREGQTQMYTLEDVEEGTFQRFVQWLYSQKFDGCLTLEDAENLVHNVGSTPETDEAFETLHDIIRLWLLGDRFLVPKLQNLAIDQLHRIQAKYNIMQAHDFHCIYEHTAPGSALRRYIVDDCALQPSEFFEKSSEMFPEDLLFNIVMADRRKKEINKVGEVKTRKDLRPEDYFVPIN